MQLRRAQRLSRVAAGHRLGRDGSLLTILYDGDCGICGIVARALRRWDRKGQFAIVALQDAPDSRDPRLAQAARVHALADELHLVDDSGRVAAGGAAALAIIDALPGGALLRPWAALPPFRAVVAIAYRWVAAHRAPIGRLLGVELVCATVRDAGVVR